MNHSFLKAKDRSAADVSLMPLICFCMETNEETRRIMNYLSHSNARYIAIQKDFKVLTEEISTITGKELSKF